MTLVRSVMVLLPRLLWLPLLMTSDLSVMVQLPRLLWLLLLMTIMKVFVNRFSENFRPELRSLKPYKTYGKLMISGLSLPLLPVMVLPPPSQ